MPTIRVTEVSEESNEQNVPVSQAHPESLETEVAELLEETEKEDDDAGGNQDAEAKDRYFRMCGALLMSGIDICRSQMLLQTFAEVKCSCRFMKILSRSTDHNNFSR